jgi:hypothetical protein
LSVNSVSENKIDEIRNADDAINTNYLTELAVRTELDELSGDVNALIGDLDDMKKLGNMKIYNRLVWGILYAETAADLMYGFSEEVKNTLRRQLEATGFK